MAVAEAPGLRRSGAIPGPPLQSRTGPLRGPFFLHPHPRGHAAQAHRHQGRGTRPGGAAPDPEGFRTGPQTTRAPQPRAPARPGGRHRRRDPTRWKRRRERCPGQPATAGSVVGFRTQQLLAALNTCCGRPNQTTMAALAGELPAQSARWGGTGVGGVRLHGSIEAGCLLYHHSCRAGARRCGNRVITVRVGRAPGWSSSIA